MGDAGDRRWFALNVKHQHEHAIEEALRYKDYVAFSPTYLSRRQWSDRSKETRIPLFPGYVFCHFDLVERLKILRTPGVCGIVGFGGTAAAIPQAEMDALQTAVNARTPLRPWSSLKSGDRVRVERGPLRGIEGAFVREKNAWTLVIGVQLLQRWIAVDVDPFAVTPLHAFASCA